MPINRRGNWVSRDCAQGEHSRCPHDFDEGGGRTAYCDCDCHRAKRDEEKKKAA